MSSEQQFYCKKCGKQAPYMRGDLRSEEQEYKYCVDCGAAYDWTVINFEKVAGSPLYKKISEMNNLFFIEHKRDYFNLMSDEAASTLNHLTKYILPKILKEFVNDEKREQQIDNCISPLVQLYTPFVLGGYFIWIAEQILAGKKIGISKPPNYAEFFNECRIQKDIVYADFFQCIKSSQDSNSISRDTAFVLQTYVLLQGHSFFSALEQLLPLEDIYLHVQTACVLGMVYGYSFAMVDARYRM